MPRSVIALAPETVTDRARGRITRRDLTVFLHACRLTFAAQGLGRRRNVAEVADRMLRLHFLPQGLTPEEATLAARRAASRLNRWPGLLTTCLVRSLVAGVLLAEREGVELALGFRPGEDTAQGAETEAVQGHAWLLLDGTPLSDPDALEAERNGYTEMVRFTLRRSYRTSARRSSPGGTP